MGRFIKGDVVVIPFPFSDLSSNKRRPALVLSALDGDDVILCQITSREVRDEFAIPLSIEDFREGKRTCQPYFYADGLYCFSNICDKWRTDSRVLHSNHRIY